MKKRPLFTRSAAAAAIVIGLSAGLSAHDFWIEPSTYSPRPDEAVRIQLRVGERFAGEPVARNGAAIERFIAVGPSGEKPVFGRDGLDPAGLLRLDTAGLWQIGYRSKPSPVVLPADKFEQYLREEGLDTSSRHAPRAARARRRDARSFRAA